MPRTIQGNLEAQGSRFAIVISRFNSFISERLLAGALDALGRNGAQPDDITIVWVPGSFEIPLVAKRLADSGQHSAVICLGALLRGDTPHFDFLASAVTKELAAISLGSGVPIIYGILTCNTMEQAVERAGLKSGNRGFDAAMSAIEMANLVKEIGKG